MPIRHSKHMTSFHPSHLQHLYTTHMHTFSPVPTFSAHVRLRTKKVFVSRSHHRNTNNIKYHRTTFSPKPSCPVETFANEIDINEFLDTKFKRTMVKSIMEFKECKEDTIFFIFLLLFVLNLLFYLRVLIEYFLLNSFSM